ncbi:hypothetical protein B0H14DRAFT_3443898 [Mycena olivaceomarginata]|nr:hypothetical protein B0H14DRAFT_3443898 [Mycena olivaceomarginata]
MSFRGAGITRDAATYIATLLVQLQHASLPLEFRLWILEWPKKAVMGCAWPGLPATAYCSTDDSNVQRMRGINLLGRAPQAPLVHTVQRLTRPGNAEGLVEEELPALRGSTSTNRRSISSSTRAPSSRARYTTSLLATCGTTRARKPTRSAIRDIAGSISRGLRGSIICCGALNNGRGSSTKVQS